MFQASSYIFSFYPSNQLIKEVLLSIFHRRGKLYVFLHLYIKKEKRKNLQIEENQHITLLALIWMNMILSINFFL